MQTINGRVNAYFKNNYYLSNNFPIICKTQDANSKGTCECIFLKEFNLCNNFFVTFMTHN